MRRPLQVARMTPAIYWLLRKRLLPDNGKVELKHSPAYLVERCLVERRPGNVQLKLTDAQHQKLMGARR